LSPIPFRVSSEEEAGTRVLRVEGELDMNTAAQLERELDSALASAQRSLLIDLSRCEFIDSTGIALIVKAWQEFGQDGRFALCGLGDQVARILQVTGLDATIPNHSSRAEALARLSE
jgi:anti-anti-sigma factor